MYIFCSCSCFSYYNNKEIDMVIKYVRALLNLEFPNVIDTVKQEDIGIVTPYARQVFITYSLNLFDMMLMEV